MSVSGDKGEQASPARVAVVTDSTTYLPRRLTERWGIHQVSLYVGWDGELRPELEYADLDAFYARLRDPGCHQPRSRHSGTSSRVTSRS